jgi:hypothetical protein
MTALAPSRPRQTFRQRLAEILRSVADWLSHQDGAKARPPLQKPFPFLGD